MNYYNQEVETMHHDKLKLLQLDRIRLVVKKVYDNVEPYREKMRAIGIRPADINDLSDIEHLPFTEKQDLRDNYPLGMLSVPNSEIVRVHTSSGTTGQRSAVGYTQADLDAWADVMARSLVAGGCTKDSIVHNAYGYGLFTGGLGANNGSERLGAMTLPVSGGNTSQQLQLLKDFKADTICCTPSYALYLADEMKKQGYDIKDLALKRGIMGAEPWTEEMRQEIEKRLGLKAYNIFGLSEIMGPGVAMECSQQNGMHIWEDHFLPEIIDPKTKKVLPNGSQGELVLSNLTKTGMPLLRYRTRDITSLDDTACPCRRTHIKMNPLVGRSDDMLIISGANVYPSQIESVLLSSELADYIEPHYLIVVDRENNRDRMEVKVEVKEEMVGASEAIANRIRHNVTSATGISAKITLTPPNTIQRSQGKAVRVMDNRKNGANGINGVHEKEGG